MKSYYYRNLNNTDKKIYDSIVAGIAEMKTSIPCTGSRDLNTMWNYILSDHPEFYYVNKNCNIISSIFGKNLVLSYCYNKMQVQDMNRKIDEAIVDIINNNINNHQSDYDKALVLHDYLKKNLQYDYEALDSFGKGSKGFENSYNIVGAFLKKKCVCEGFSRAMKLLCDRVGIECIVVCGTGNSTVMSGPHAWNIIRINGYYHHVDVTWDNQFSDEQQVPNYGYFNLDDKTISKDHTWNRKNYPSCDSDPYNYFKINSSLIDSQSQLEKYLYENLINEEALIMFKIVRGSTLESEISGCLDMLVNRAAKRCKYVTLKDFRYQWIPEQLVYMLQPTYK